MKLTEQDIQELETLVQRCYLNQSKYEGVLSEDRWTNAAMQAKEKFLNDGHHFKTDKLSANNKKTTTKKKCHVDRQQTVKRFFQNTSERQWLLLVFVIGFLIGNVISIRLSSVQSSISSETNIDKVFLSAVNTIEQKAIQLSSESDKDSIYSLTNELGRITTTYSDSKKSNSELVKNCISGVKELELPPALSSDRVKDCVEMIK